jgi:hypothetical protein
MNYPEKLEIKAHIRLILIISCSKKLQLLQRGFQRMLTLQPEIGIAAAVVIVYRC